MSVHSPTAPADGLRTQVLTWWGGLAVRERNGVSLALLVLGLLLLWAVAVQPALRIVRDAPPKLDQLDAESQQMQQLATESRDLRAIPPVEPVQAEAALNSATSRLGGSAQIIVQGGRATLRLNGVYGPALGAWIAEARSAARVRPIEAQLTRGPQGYTGTLTVSLGEAQ